MSYYYDRKVDCNSFVFYYVLCIYLQIIWKLHPTSGELQIDIVKKAMGLLGGNEDKRDDSYSASTSSNVSYKFLHYIYIFCFMRIWYIKLKERVTSF